MVALRRLLLMGSLISGLPITSPAASLTTWSVGIPGGLPVFTNLLSVKDFGALGDGQHDDFPAISNALQQAEAGTVIYFPTGTYRITRSLYLNHGQVLRGDGAAHTRLRFEGTGTVARCIALARWNSDQGAWCAVRSGYQQGSARLQLGTTTNIQAGDVVEIEQENDPAWGFRENWQAGLVGQIVSVVEVDHQANVVTIDPPLRITYAANRNPRLRKKVVIRQAGVEHLFVERVDAVEGSIIELKHAWQCWVRGVESYRTYRAHVWIDHGYACEIRENYFHHTWVAGGGGQGYGVVAGAHTSDTLVENNIFQSLRHAMVVTLGANGNVFGYNFSTGRLRDPRHGTLQPDISVHGAYAYQNLYEGNVAEDADVPDWYHPAGPGNTLFRNRLSNAGHSVELASPGQVVVGNELVAGGIEIAAGSGTHCIYGNVMEGREQAGADEHPPMPASLYRSERPESVQDQDSMRWPAFGPEVGPGLHTIPAQQRFERGSYFP